MITEHNETIIKADAGYYIVSINVSYDGEDFTHYRIPIIAWRISVTETDNCDIESHYYPITLNHQVIFDRPSSRECIGIEHPNGLIYERFSTLGHTLEQFIQHTVRMNGIRERSKKAKSQTLDTPSQKKLRAQMLEDATLQISKMALPDSD